MTNTTRIKALLFIILASVGVLLMAATLPDLRLSAGMPFPGADVSQSPSQPQVAAQPALTSSADLFLWIQGALSFGMLLLLAGIVYLIIVPKRRVWFRPILSYLTVMAVVTVLAAFLRPMPGDAPAIAPERIYAAPDTTIATTPLGSPPTWLILLVAGCVLLLVIVIGIWLFRQAITRQPRTSPIVQEAESALTALQGGTDLSSVIVRCYLRMSQAVLEEQGLSRDETLTPREFELYFAARGVPVEPLRALTRLFEAVRYGRKAVDQQAEGTAVACLTAIIQHCKAEAVRP